MNWSTEVEQRITDCRRTQSDSLDLSDCELFEFPVAVCELQHLRILNLSSNHLSWLPFAFSNLYNLLELDLGGNRFSTIPELVFDLHELQLLNSSGNQLEEVSERISRLRKLKVLDFSFNYLSELPESITQLHNLEELIIDNNQFTTLPDTIIRLSNLYYLSVEDNPLRHPPLEIATKGIDVIRKYYAEFELETDVPEELSSEDLEAGLAEFDEQALFTLEHKYYAELDIDEIEELSSEDWEADLDDKFGELSSEDWEAELAEFSEQASSTLKHKISVQAPGDTLFEAKLLLLGEGRVGKTSLAKSLIDPGFILQDEVSTPGIEVQSWIIPKQETGFAKDFRFNIWDFGGQEIYHQTHQFFLTKRSLYLLVTESRKEEKHDDFYYWLNIIRLLGDRSPIILVLNKCDQPTKALPVNEYQAAFENLVEFHQVSCHPDYKSTLMPLREAIRRIITNSKLMPDIGIILPGVWVRIREEIARLQETGTDYISRDEYYSLCARHGMPEARADFLSEQFHDIGVFLHFKDIALCETVILNYEWMTSGVYRVLDSQRVIDQKGRFSDTDLTHIWRDEKFRHKRVELCSLMMNRKFELIYELQSGVYLAPQLLPVDEIDYEWRDDKDNLRFEYCYKFMPKGILTRFIVKCHKDIYHETCWRYGVLLHWDDTRALVRERYFERKITIRLEGTNQRGFLDIIRKTIHEIHDSFNNLEVQEMIPCNCGECIRSEKPHFFDYATLRLFLRKRKYTDTCDKSVEEIDICALISETGLPERVEQEIHYHNHIRGDYIRGHQIRGDMIDTDIEDSKNVAVGKRARVRHGP